MTQDPLVRFLDQRSARYQRRARLRVLASSELTDAAISIYQELGGTILRYTAVSTLFSLASLIFVTAYVFPNFFLTNHPGDIGSQIVEVVVVVGIGLLVAAPLLTIGIGFSSAFIIGMVADYMNGVIAAPLENLAKARKMLFRVAMFGVWQTLLAFSGILVGLGLIMVSALIGNSASEDNGPATVVSVLATLGLITGTISLPIVLCRQILVLPIAVIEGLGYRAAARRNRELMKGNRVHTPGYGYASTIFFLCAFLVLFIWGGANLVWGTAGLEPYLNDWLKGNPFHDTVMNGVRYLPLYVTVLTVIPVWCVGATLLYFERRTRLEGYDIEALAQDLGKHGKKNRFDL